MTSEEKLARIAAAQSLMQTMTAFSTQPLQLAALPKVVSTDGVDLSAMVSDGPAALGIASANSATAIAEAIAALGMGTTEEDAAAATVIWNENLKQIARIQDLYGLKRLPFQNAQLPAASPQFVEP